MRSLLQGKSKNKGFTMIEIILVVAGLAILMGLGVNQGIKFMTNMNTSDATTAQNTFIQAVSQAIMQESALAKQPVDSSAMKGIDLANPTDPQRTVIKFVARLNEYLDGDFKLTYYDGKKGNIPAALTSEGLQDEDSGFYTTRKDKWGMHYKVEFHCADNGLTGNSYQTLNWDKPRPVDGGYTKTSGGGGAKARDNELRIFIKSFGKNGSSIIDKGSGTAIAFSMDNDDILTMYQYVNAVFSNAYTVRASKESPDPLLIRGGTAINALSLKPMGKPEEAFKVYGETASLNCVINEADYAGESTCFWSYAILEVKGQSAASK